MECRSGATTSVYTPSRTKFVWNEPRVSLGRHRSFATTLATATAATTESAARRTTAAQHARSAAGNAVGCGVAATAALLRTSGTSGNLTTPCASSLRAPICSCLCAFFPAPPTAPAAADGAVATGLSWGGCCGAFVNVSFSATAPASARVRT